MLWKRPRTDRFPDAAGPSPAAQDELRGYLADRLRLALDFATLGAYELTGEDDAPVAGADAEQRRPAPAAAEPSPTSHRSSCCTDRHRRQAAPAHTTGAGRCPVGEKDGGGSTCTWNSATSRANGSVRVARARVRPWRRAGVIATPPQPCTWVEPSA